MNKQKWTPAKMLELSGGYWYAATIHAAVKSGVFQAIDNKKLKSKEVSRKIHADRRAVEMLLNALTSMNLLVKEGEKFSNTDFSCTFLLKRSPGYIGHMIMHHHHLMKSWTKLDQAIKTGKPVRKMPSGANNREMRENFLMGMFNLAMETAPRLAETVDLSGRRRFLDLGGGPGTFAIHFCLKNPRLTAAVFDLSTTRPFAAKVIKRFNLSDRIKFVAGDYLKDRIKGAYDVVFLSHILHGEGPEGCRKIIRQAVSVLEPGGMLIVHDFILKNTMDAPLFPAVFSLNMLLGRGSGQSYSERQIREILVGAGIKKIKRLSFKGFNDSGLITGIA